MCACCLEESVPPNSMAIIRVVVSFVTATPAEKRKNETTRASAP